MSVRRDSRGRFAGGGGGGGGSSRGIKKAKGSTGSRGQRAEAITSLERSKSGLRQRARDTNKALPKDGSAVTKMLRSSEARLLRENRASINQLRKDVRGSASQVGAALGGKRKRAKIKR